MKRIIIPYNPKLKELARQLRNNSTKSEIYLWKYLSGKQMMGYDFHRQKPIDNYILDFFCHDLMLGIELDGISHQFDDSRQRDIEKEQRLTELGIFVLRFADKDVHNDIKNVLTAIEGYILMFIGREHTPNPSQEGKNSPHFRFAEQMQNKQP